MKKHLLLLFLLLTPVYVAAQSPTATPQPTTKRRLPPVLKKETSAPAKRQTQETQPAKAEPEEVYEGETVRVTTALVTVPVSVMDSDGRYVADLKQEEFRILEDGREQDLAFFASTEKPFTVALMLDVSDSAIFRMDEVKDAAVAFVNQLRTDDRAIIISFDRQMQILTKATSDKEILTQAIRGVGIGAGTSLYNAVDMTLKQVLGGINGRKAIVLFTDGVDTSSMGASYTSTIRDAAESDSLIYTVQYGLTRAGRRYNIQTTSTGVGYSQVGVVGRTQRIIADKYLYTLPERTGGRQFYAKTIESLSKSFAEIAEELRHQYSLGYYPQSPAQPGQQKRIKVQVTRPKLVVRSRNSYLSNSSEDAAPANGQE